MFTSFVVFSIAFTLVAAECPTDCPGGVLIPSEEVLDYGKNITDRLKENCTVHLGPFNYPIETNIKITEGPACVIGAGSKLTHLVATKADANVSEDGLLKIEGVEDVSLMGLSLDMSHCDSDKLCKYGIKAKESGKMKFEDLAIYGASTGTTTDGVHLVESTNDYYAYLKQIMVSSVTGSCVFGRNSNMTVNNSIAKNCGKNGYSVDGGDMKVTDSYAVEVGEGGCGVRVEEPRTCNKTVDPAFSVVPSECPRTDCHGGVLMPSEEVLDYGKNITDTLKENCTLLLGPYNYPIKTNIKITEGPVCIVGGGSNVTTLVAKKADANVNEDGLLKIEGVEEVSLIGLSIDMSHCESAELCKYGIKTKDSGKEKMMFMDLAINGASTEITTDGVYLFDSAGDYSELENIMASNVNRSGVLGRNSSIAVHNSVTRNCGKHGYSSVDGGDIKVTDSYAIYVGRTSKRGCGVNVEGKECENTPDAKVDGLSADANDAGVCAEFAKLNVTNSEFFFTVDQKERCFLTSNITSFSVSNNTCHLPADKTNKTYDGQQPNTTEDVNSGCPTKTGTDAETDAASDAASDSATDAASDASTDKAW